MRFVLGAGGSNSRELQEARLGKLAEKMGRLRIILAKCRKVPAKTFGRMHAALQAGPLFGCEAHQLDQETLRKLRRQAAAWLWGGFTGLALGRSGPWCGS